MKVSFWREGFPTLPCLPPQMWGAACGGPHPLHWRHKHGVLYTRRSHPVPSQHHRPGEAGDSPAPSDPPGPEGTWPWWVELLHPSLFLALAAFFLQRVRKTSCSPPLSYHQVSFIHPAVSAGSPLQAFIVTGKSETERNIEVEIWGSNYLTFLYLLKLCCKLRIRRRKLIWLPGGHREFWLSVKDNESKH